MTNFWLTEEQFKKISSLLPNKPRGVPRVDDQRVLSGIIFCIKRGYRWSVWSQHVVGWVDFELAWLTCPDFADVFERREALQRLQSAGVIICRDEIGDVRFKL